MDNLNNTHSYNLLPFRFSRASDDKVLLVNEAGEHIFLHHEDFSSFIDYSLSSSSKPYLNLKASQFLFDKSEALPNIVDMLATKYRTKKSFLRNFTTLHMVVTTLRCNHNCAYCHASSAEANATRWDMSIETARKVTDTIFQSPSPSIKIEFQGGESLLNFPVIEEIVRRAEKINKKAKRHLQFVLCSNITLMNDYHLSFLKSHGVLVSTSLDGPKEFHNVGRIMRDGGDSYSTFIEKLALTRKELGHEKVSALLTVTNQSLHHLTRVVDEYIRLGFNGIFLRPLNPYGYAKKESGRKLNYGTDEFVEAYKDTLRYILDLNIKGARFKEYFASIILSRILTPFSTGFMDLQSPAGAGILGVIYNFDGDVYPTDEGRMLAAVGDKQFRMGNVFKDSYNDMFNGSLLHKITANSCTEVIPGCHSCPLQIYCGSDPTRAYSQQGDIDYMGHIPSSEFCKKHKSIISHLLTLIETDSQALDIFWAWVTDRRYEEIKL